MKVTAIELHVCCDTIDADEVAESLREWYCEHNCGMHRMAVRQVPVTVEDNESARANFEAHTVD